MPWEQTTGLCLLRWYGDTPIHTIKLLTKTATGFGVIRSMHG